MSEIDLTLALQLQAQFEEELRVSLLKQQEEKNKQKNEETPLYLNLHGRQKTRKPFDEPQQEKLSVSLTDPTWEMIDPNPDIHTLFLTFNDQFFWGRLSGIEVRWSPRMTLCAGLCCYEGRGGLCSVRLSLPLLKLRPRKDLVETLLHEMIHAYLFVTANNRDRDGHGPEFHKHMYRINSVAGTNITVFHTFHDEVDVYRQHVWQCNGPCRTRQPYFGLLKRSMNRAPGPKDHWWERHQQTCGGTYIKIQEPDRSGVTKKESRTSSKNKTGGCSDIRKFMEFTGENNYLEGATSKAVHPKNKQDPVEVNKRDDSSKENNPSCNIKRKIESGNKQNKVSGFASTSNGELNQIKVAGASNSNVHGFGGHSPARKKPCGGNGISAGKMSGNKNIKRNPGNTGTASVAVRGSGSRTVTVKGKTDTQTEIQVKESSNQSSSCAAFQGHGYTLGGSTTDRVSRLLSLSAISQFHSNSKHPSTSSKTQPDYKSEVHSDKKINRKDNMPRPPVSSAQGNAADKLQNSPNCYVVTPSSSLDRKTVRCPVCDTSVPEKDINKHLDECVGNLTDEDVMEDVTKEAPCKRVPSTSEVIHLRDSNTCISDSDNGGEFAHRDLQKCPEDEKSEQYLCPVCGDSCSPTTINQHLDTHF